MSVMLAPPAEVSARLVAVLRPVDLVRPAAAFRQRVEHRLKGIGRPGELVSQCRIEGWAQGRIIQLRRRVEPAEEWITLLIWTDGKRVVGQELDRGALLEMGWRPVAWRRAGARLVGLNLDLHGNWAQPCAVVLQAKAGRWERRSLRVSHNEGWNIAFKSRRSWDVLVNRRSDDFRALTASHAGPLLTERAIWTFDDGRYRAQPFRRIPNALDAFDRLVARALTGDERYVRQTVPDAAVRRRFLAEVQASSGGRTVTCPYSKMAERGRVFGVYSYNAGGHKPSWFFEFALRKGRWQIIHSARESTFSRPDVP